METVRVSRFDVEVLIKRIFTEMAVMEANGTHTENPVYDILNEVSLMFDSALEDL